jgi:hypothetical protein
MTNRILTDEGWQERVREVIGVDQAYLPDQVLEKADVVDIAESNIIDLVPDYETIPEDKKVYLESATVCECAVLACDSMPARLPVKESGPHVSFELEIDWEKKKIEFAEKRDMHISKLVKTPDVTYFAIS